MKKLLCLGLALCLILVSLAACSAAGNKASDATGDLEYSKGTLTEDYGSTNTTAGSSVPDISDRKMIRDAELTVETKKFDSFLTALEKKVVEMEGYIESSSVNNEGYSKGYRRATFVARIPSDSLDGFLNAVGKLGSISHKSITTNDVTGEYIDAESRVAALKTEQASLMELLKTATKLDDILEIQDRLSDVTAELELYQKKMNSIDARVSYSTVTLSIREVELDPTNDQQGFWGETGTRFMNNLYSIGSGAKSVAMWLISSLPYLLLLGGIGLAIWLPIRRKVRRRRAARQAAKQNKQD